MQTCFLFDLTELLPQLASLRVLPKCFSAEKLLMSGVLLLAFSLARGQALNGLPTEV